MEFTIFAPIIAGVIRNFAGWIENALKDSKITSYEWGQLLSTTVQVAVIGYGAMVGLNLEPMAAGAIGILGSIGISTVKKAGNTK